jgi:hypothetical protein
MTEEWRLIPGTWGYHVSNMGRVKRLRHTGTTIRILRPVNDGKGYLRVRIVAYGFPRRMWFVHQLVMLVFLGECPKGYQINHIDSNRSNNRLDNLEYVTPQENQRHSWQTTQRQPPHRGERTHFAKLTEANVIEIRKMRAWDGLTYTEIARHFNTKPANVWHICAGKTWKHLL